MPVIQVQWLAGRSQEVRRELAAAITEQVSRIGSCPPEAVHVVFTDVPPDHWAKGGTLTSEA